MPGEQPANGIAAHQITERPVSSSRASWAWLDSLKNVVPKTNGKNNQLNASGSSVAPAQSGRTSSALMSPERAKEASRGGSEKKPTASTASKQQASSKDAKSNGKAVSTLARPADREFIPLGKSKAQTAGEKQEARAQSTASVKTAPTSASQQGGPVSQRQPQGAAISPQEDLAAGKQPSSTPKKSAAQTFSSPSRLAGAAGRGKAAGADFPLGRHSSSPSNPSWNSPAKFAKFKQQRLIDMHSPVSEKATAATTEPQGDVPSPPPDSDATAGLASTGSGPASTPSRQSKASKETYVGLPKIASPPPALGIWKNDDPPAAPSSATQASVGASTASVGAPLATATAAPAFSLGGGICMPPGHWGPAGRSAAMTETPKLNGKVSSMHA